MIDAIRALFASETKAKTAPPADFSGSSGTAPDPLHLAACALLLEVAHADGEFSDAERAHVESALARHFSLPAPVGSRLIELAEAERGRSIDYFEFTNTLKTKYSTGQKLVLAEVIWGLVLSDGQIAKHEHYLTRKIANLLELEPGYLATAKAAAEKRAGSEGRGGKA